MSSPATATAVKTFANQDKLPRLPVPPLPETLQRYLRTTRPHFATQAEYEAYAATVADFAKDGALGPQLQARLEAHAKAQPSSWLEDWWLRLAYLSWREPLLINSNWFLLTAPHPDTPRALMTDGDRARPATGQFTDFQLLRAAGFVSNLVTFKDMLEREVIKPEATRAGPQCMNQYRNIFGISRIPKPDCDVLVGGFKSPSKHIIVLVRDQIYAVNVYDQQTGKRLAISDILRQLRSIVAEVTAGKDIQPPVCIMTSENRNNWAKSRAHLESLGGANTETFKWIDSALFAVSLDDRAIPYTVEDQGKFVFHNFDGRNRWFDTCITVAVSNDARIGINGEHSPCDALVPALAVDFAAKNEPAKDSPGAILSAPTANKARRLTWNTDAKIGKAIVDAQAAASKLIADSDLTVMHFAEYGGDFIKKNAKVSPDAYIQMCLQLTYYRIHGQFAAVYETASTRKFLHGRTETCRSLSLEAQAFARTMQAPNATPAEKYKALQTACKAHVDYLAVASDGRGVDRHLLGLRLVMKDGESSDVFKHPVFAQSSKWQLSTSALFPSDRLYGTGFGAVVVDGYGMNYTIGDKIIKMGVESKVSCKETSTAKFKSTFEQVLRDVAAMCADVNSPQAKL
ncbi:acyltransferase ChoActase/COT/CPT [Entophlyctis helioformis]|nr:acyltransferase ChoActase/COT/CPT [Entophlyctis helioformis]